MSVPKICDSLSRFLPIAFIALIFAVGILYRDFVKFPLLGPLYPLELAAIVLALGLCVYSWGAAAPQMEFSGKFARKILTLVSHYFIPSKILLFFFAWGMARLAWDLIFSPSDFPKRLAFQYSLVFIYPALWSGIAYAFFRLFPEQRNRTVLSLAIAVSLGYLLRPAHFDLRTLIVDVKNNVSLGSLAVIPAILMLAQAFIIRREAKLYALGFIGLVLVLIPFWLMWFSAIQRTSFAVLVMNIILVTVLLAWHSPRRGAWAGGMALLLLLGGSLWAIALRDQKVALSKTYQRGDDQFQGNPGDSPGQIFAARYRRFFWSTALADWREAPVFGRGFALAVPSQIYAGVANDGSMSEGTPIAGVHNSYLTILARLGLLGFALMLAAAAQIFMTSRQLLLRAIRSSKASPPDWQAWILPILILNGALYAFFHLGLESPHNAFLFWLGVGFAFAARE